MNNLYAYPAVERRGLCNMLFPWARAVLFARDHNCKVIAPSWVKINRLGPILRRERDKRYYLGQFTNCGYVKGIKKWWLLSTCTKVCEDVKDTATKGVVVFNELRNYFEDLKGGQAYIEKELLKITSQNILERLEMLPKHFIGVHIRMGDFAKIGQCLPGDYYLRAIERARKITGEATEVLVFSDAKVETLSYLNEISNVCLMPSGAALHDMLALSRAEVLVGTNLSTFSEWAAFLGGMKNLWCKSGGHPNYFQNAELI